MNNIKNCKVEIRMYRMGTGDCFALKFYDKDDNITLKMMIDAGVCNISKTDLTPYMKDLLKFVDNEVDVLIVTHEHTDHVLAFQRCEQLFVDKFTAKEIWFGWTEDDNNSKVKRWKKEYGQKKFALHQSSNRIRKAYTELEEFNPFALHPKQDSIMQIHSNQRDTIQSFIDLSLGEEGSFNANKKKKYIGDLKGMSIVKDKFGKEESLIKYKTPGEIVDDFESKTGIKIYILGPPEIYKQVEIESGGEGDSYDHSHNKHDFNFALLNALDEKKLDGNLPFPKGTVYRRKSTAHHEYKNRYLKEEENWRRIDYDWIFSTATFALRMNSLTNNLSLAIAIEIQETQDVLLFPGDAEFGSWASWHKIKWPKKNEQEFTTEDLLNRTVVYKVAHHMSHNGTAREKGLDMMTSKALVAFVPLSWKKGRIGHNWANTMPNKYILEELLNKTKGKIFFCNSEKMKFNDIDLSEEIERRRSKMNRKEKAEFQNNHIDNPLFHQYTIAY